MGRPRRNWTSEEDGLLREAVNNALLQNRPLLWRELAKSVPARSNKDCRRRWWNSLADGMSKGPWSEDEDQRLIEAVRKCGCRWSHVARAVGSRNSNQCSSHWTQTLNPDINYQDFDNSEVRKYKPNWATFGHETYSLQDERLLHAVLTNGTEWTKIAASHVPQRTTLALKNRYSTLRSRHKNKEYRKSSTSSTTAPSKTRLSVSSSGQDDDAKQRDTDDERDGEDDYDDDDDDDDEEDEYDESFAFQNYATSTVPLRKLQSNSLAAHTLSPSHTGGLDVPGTGMWAGANNGKDPPLSANMQTSAFSHPSHWMNEMHDPLAYMSTMSHQQASDITAEGYHGQLLDMSGISAGMQAGEAMDFTLSAGQPFPEPMTLGNAHTGGQNHAMSDISYQHTDSGSSVHDLNLYNTPSSATDLSHISGGNARSPDSTAASQYQVSINMLCSVPQLKTLMGALAGAGTCVSLKVDPNS